MLSESTPNSTGPKFSPSDFARSSVNELKLSIADSTSEKLKNVSVSPATPLS